MKTKIMIVCACAVLCVALSVTIIAMHKEPVVQSAEDAISIAMPVFIEKFGENEGDTAWSAEYDRRAGTWHVYGFFPSLDTVGGTPEAIISAKDGQIIRIWHGK